MAILTFHGSPHDFEAFDFSKMGTEGGVTGAGFGLYFSTSKADSISYGPIIYTCMLDLKTNVSNSQLTLNQPKVSLILRKLQSLVVAKFIDCSDAAAEGFLKLAKTDTNLITNIVKLTGCSLEEMMLALSLAGFTHTVDLDSPEESGTTHYIVYDLRAIKIIDKENFN